MARKGEREKIDRDERERSKFVLVCPNQAFSSFLIKTKVRNIFVAINFFL